MKKLICLILSATLVAPASYANNRIQSSANRVFKQVKTTHNMLELMLAASHSESDKKFFQMLLKNAPNEKLPSVILSNEKEMQLSTMKSPLKFVSKTLYSYEGARFNLDPSKELAPQFMRAFLAMSKRKQKSASLSLFPKAHAKDKKEERYWFTERIDPEQHRLGQQVANAYKRRGEEDPTVFMKLMSNNAFKLLTGIGVAALGAWLTRVPVIGLPVGGITLIAGILMSADSLISQANAEEPENMLPAMICAEEKHGPISLEAHQPNGKILRTTVNFAEDGQPTNMVITEGDKELSRCFMEESFWTSSWSINGKCMGQDLDEETRETLLNATHALQRTCATSRPVINQVNEKLAEVSNNKFPTQKNVRGGDR